jgi:hypothetical protein
MLRAVMCQLQTNAATVLLHEWQQLYRSNLFLSAELPWSGAAVLNTLMVYAKSLYS